MSDAVPDIAGEIVAWRAWYVARDRFGVRLVSLNDGDEWPVDGWMVAECGGERDDVPHEGCTCGIHAAHDRQHLHKLGYVVIDDEVVVVGEVALAGKVIRGAAVQSGERIYKAEKARPLRLLVSYEHWPYAGPLAGAYGVPVMLSNPTKLLRGGSDV